MRLLEGKISERTQLRPPELCIEALKGSIVAPLCMQPQRGLNFQTNWPHLRAVVTLVQFASSLTSHTFTNENTISFRGGRGWM
jgi:hypothetical protein